MVESASSGASTEPTGAPLETKHPTWSGWRSLWPLLVACGLILGIGLVQSRPLAHAAQVPGSWPPSVLSALEQSRALGRPLHLHFTRPDAPLAKAMDETLTLEPVRQIAEAHFVSVRVDSRVTSELFRRLIGGAGALASCIVDLDAAGQADVIAVAAGYSDPAGYVAFLDGVAKNLPRLRELRDTPAPQAATGIALGELYAEQGSAARARRIFEGIAAPAERAAALEHLARLDVEAGQTARARQQLEQARALRSPPQSSRLIFTEALILSGERRVSEAVTLLTGGLAARQSPAERARSLLLLAQLEHELKHDDRAMAHLEAVRAESPDSAWSRAADERIRHIANPEPNHTH